MKVSRKAGPLFPARSETFVMAPTPNMQPAPTHAAFRRERWNMSEMRMPLGFNILSWVLRTTAAVILLQTLFFKFTAAPESVYIFTKVGAEPWGRIGSGVVELIAAILI